jgi:hypothetical protein
MSDGAPRNNHTVSAGYVRRFTGTHNTVTVHHRQRGTFDKGPRGVGRQLDYWGSPEISSELEALFCRMESDGLRLLRNLRQRWPLTSTVDRPALGLLLAIHIVRMPSFSGDLRLLGERASREVLAEHAPEYGLDEQQIATVAEGLRGHRVHADTLLRQVPRIASALCSMHWSVVEFEEDWLITCDQPVVLLPLVPRPISPASALPRDGFMNTLEGRFTLDPRRMLLLSWRDERDGLWLAGDYAHACNVNCALKAQSLQEWFCRPGSSPPFLAPPILEERVSPLSLALLPGYTFESAAASQRRQAADRTIAKLLDKASSGQMRWVRVGDVDGSTEAKLG